jgi:hypothetical protein
MVEQIAQSPHLRFFACFAAAGVIADRDEDSAAGGQMGQRPAIGPIGDDGVEPLSGERFRFLFAAGDGVDRFGRVAVAEQFGDP